MNHLANCALLLTCSFVLSGCASHKTGKDCTDNYYPPGADKARHLFVHEKTRQYNYVDYLDQCIGQINNAKNAGSLKTIHSNYQNRKEIKPRIEVAINADGSLEDILIIESSGQNDIDQAYIDIVRLAAPFPPFPEHIDACVDVLHIKIVP